LEYRELPLGRLNLSAPAPRMPDGKPDLSGMWQMNLGFYVVNVTQDLDAKDIQRRGDPGNISITSRKIR
jgi:hypothetical protein